MVASAEVEPKSYGCLRLSESSQEIPEKLWEYPLSTLIRWSGNSRPKGASGTWNLSGF